MPKKTPKTPSDRQNAPRECLICRQSYPVDPEKMYNYWQLLRIVLPQKGKGEGALVRVVYYHDECLRPALIRGEPGAIMIAKELKRRRDEARTAAAKIKEEGKRLMTELYENQDK